MNKKIYIFLCLVLQLIVAFADSLLSDEIDSLSSHNLFIKSLFPMMGEDYPQQIAKEVGRQSSYITKNEINETYQRICKTFLFDKYKELESTTFFVYFPSVNDIPCIGYCIFIYEGIYVTASFADDFVAFTFEFEDEPLLSPVTISEKNLLQIQEIIPLLKKVYFKSSENNTMGNVVALPNVDIDSAWINSVQWWYSPGKLGISFLNISVPSRAARYYFPHYPNLKNKVSRNLFTIILFPMFKEVYSQSLTNNLKKKSEYAIKKSMIEDCHNTCKTFLSKQLKNVENIQFIYFPVVNKTPAKSIGIISYDDIFITISFVEDLVGFTFEFEDASSESSTVVPEKVIKMVQNIIPALKMVTLKTGEKNQLGFAKPLAGTELDTKWIDSIQWWYSPGKFGISFLREK
ncbi:MAG: hypothetical protein LBT04_04815 [Prevotellaceae bacterium]|jgi:hypothetical protein|nr:hypothetical protein [Prevotellaceae bacterium]